MCEGIKVTLVQPGTVKTQFVGRMLDQQKEFDEKFPEGSDCQKYYSKPLRKLSSVVEGMMKGAVEPEVIASRVYQVITAGKPKNITYDTWGSWFTVALVHTLPVWMVDRMFSKIATGE